MEEKNKTACQQTKRQYKISQVALLDVLTIQEKWIGAEIAKLDVAGKRLINRVNPHLPWTAALKNHLRR